MIGIVADMAVLALKTTALCALALLAMLGGAALVGLFQYHRAADRQKTLRMQDQVSTSDRRTTFQPRARVRNGQSAMDGCRHCQPFAAPAAKGFDR